MEAFSKRGLEDSLNLVSKIFKEDPTFSKSCHDVGHLLGKETYKLFKNGKDFKITPEVSFCSYGFYHGFMELLASEGDVKKARDFCKYVDSQIAKETPDASLQCFHGIGHGWVNIHGDTNLLGDDLGIIKKGLGLCEKVSGNDSELSRCATGVFNGIAIFYDEEEYGLKVRPDDPLWMCRLQDKKYQDPCYISMNIVLASVSHGNLKTAASFVEPIIDDDIAAHTMINLAIPFGLSNADSGDHSENINICRSLQKRLVVPCLQGYAFSFLEHGEPQKEYIKAIGFCRNSLLTKNEMEGCLTYIYSYLAQWYPVEKAFKICDEEGVYKDFCISNVEIGISGLNK